MSIEHALERLEFDKVRQRLMRYAASDIGRATLAGMMPSTSLAEIRAGLALVSELKRLLQEEGDFPLTGIYQVTSLIQRSAVEGAILFAKDLTQVGSTLRAARVLRTFVVKRRDRYPLIWDIADRLFTDKVLEFNIEQAIDESGAVRASASRELQSIRRIITERYEHLKRRLEGILKNVSELGFTQDDIITTREGRMVIPVKVEHKHRVPGFIHSASASGATVFIEPTETLELNNEIRSLQFQEQREIDRILKDLTLQVRDRGDSLLSNVSILARLDVLHARAKYSTEILGVEPVVTEEGPIKLIQARHPILLMTHGYNTTVPLDLDLGSTFNTLVISGPNAGGKSVALKCVGLLVLMAQSGLHIPASEQSRLRMFKKIFVDIGDDQSIENDLSTFSSHLANLKLIAGEADRSSLVLIDEIGTGTDPAEGGAIAASMLESLTRCGAFTVATTHHGALKVFAHETEGVENGAMEFDQETLTPTYRFKSGVPGSSYALEMAERMGFQDGLLKRSRDFLGHQQTKLENLIAELEASSQRYKRDLELLLAEKQRVDLLVNEYESKIAAQAKELREVKRKAIDEARQIVERANAVIERSIKEIKEKGADKTTTQDVRREVAQLKEEIRAKEEEVKQEPSAEKPEMLTVGSAVKLAGENEVGEIKSIAPDGKTAVVVFGIVKMKLRMSELQRAPLRTPSSAQAPVQLREKFAALAHGLDLRGMTGEEAIPLVDKFIDDAALVGLHRIDIIHGKGTGALRRKVTEFLSHHPRVKTYRLAEWNEGGTGATVVELADN